MPVVLLLAKPLVLPVALSELLELVDGEDVAEVLELPEDVSLLATEPVVDEPVEVVALPVVSLLAKPLVLPVALIELLELDDGEVEAELLD